MKDKIGLGNILQQAQVLQEKLARVQEEAGAQRVEASAGGGMVKVQFNGRLELLGLTIDPQVAGSGDLAMLQDLIVAAVNQGIRDAQKLMASEMGKVTGGLKLPGMG